MHRRSVLTAVVLIAALPGCSSGTDRPGIESWGRQWRAIEPSVPTPDAIVTADDPATICDEALAAVREDRGGQVDTTPTDTIDQAFERWVSASETYLFECPFEDEGQLRDLAETASAAAERVDGLLGQG